MNEEKILKLFSLKKKIVVITGGAGMLGQEYTNILSAAGAKVAWFDINSTPSVDITNKNQVKKATQTLVKNFGKIDILINNAALNPSPKNTENYEPYEKMPLELLEKHIRVGLLGAQICTQSVAPIMMEQKSGVIVNISSDLGLIAPDNRIYNKEQFKSVAYSVVKSGILGLTRAWASYLAPYKVRVNALALGGVFNNQSLEFVRKNSRLNMLNRMAGKDEYNGAIIFLCSNASSYMTGQTLIIDGGRTAW